MAETRDAERSGNVRLCQIKSESSGSEENGEGGAETQKKGDEEFRKVTKSGVLESSGHRISSFFDNSSEIEIER